MKIGNVPSGEANFTLPTPHWVGPVSRRLRCCNKSSRRLLARTRTAACFSGSQSLGAAVGSHPHMRWRAAVGHCVVFALVRKPCWIQTTSTQTSFLCHRLLRFSEFSLLAWTAAGIDYFVLCFSFSFYRRPRRFSHNWISFSGFLSHRMFERKEKKRSLPVFGASTQSWPFRMFLFVSLSW